MKKGKSNTGFSLAELMIAMAVMGIGLGIAVPTFSSLIANQRLTSSANEMLSVFDYARMEAVRHRGYAVVCPTLGGNSCDGQTDWSRSIMFVDENRNGSRDQSEPVLRRWDLSGVGLVVAQQSGPSPARVTFGATGFLVSPPTGQPPTVIRLCSPGFDDRSRQMSIYMGGARIHKGDGNGC